MSMTLRLDPGLDAQLEGLAAQTGRSKTSLVTEGVRRLIEQSMEETPATAFETMPPELILSSEMTTAEMLNLVREERF